MNDKLAALAARRAVIGAPPLPEDELAQVMAMLEDLEQGLARMPDGSAIDPAVRFAVAGRPQDEGTERCAGPSRPTSAFPSSPVCCGGACCRRASWCAPASSGSIRRIRA
jgi:hypothetical protein